MNPYNPPMKSWLDDIEVRLKQVLPLHVDKAWISSIIPQASEFPDYQVFNAICEPARDLVYQGGKRWRPLFMLLTAKMLGGAQALEIAKQLVALVELPHNGSLIVDDIEDGSDLRRGKPATHITHGIDYSINAGNLLYYLPTITIDSAPVADSVKLRIYQIYANYMRKIHMGQGMDIAWHHDQETIPDVAAYETMCRLKTGCLAAMGCEIGAVIATDDVATVERAGAIAETIGLGFQILDDVINLEKGNPGKNRGDDIVENKKSLPIILYATAHPERKEHLFSVFLKAKQSGYNESEREILELISYIEDSGALHQARLRAENLFSRVLQEIETLYKPSSDREFFIELIKGFIQAAQ